MPVLYENCAQAEEHSPVRATAAKKVRTGHVIRRSMDSLQPSKVDSIPELMSSPALSSYLLPLLLAVVSCSSSPPGLEIDARSSIATSTGPWLQYVDVRQAGFDGQALQAVCERADSLQSGAVLAVFRGRVILACGDVSRKFEAHSVRKSLVSGLYGTAVARDEIDLNSTLAHFAVDELTPLTATERSATIRQVISARSGVYPAGGIRSESGEGASWPWKSRTRNALVLQQLGLQRRRRRVRASHPGRSLRVVRPADGGPARHGGLESRRRFPSI